MAKRDEFLQPVKDKLAKRAAYICSNPDCRAMTIAASEQKDDSYLYMGKAAHITAAAVNGPRYDKNISPEQRRNIENGIFLCGSCADIIDCNNGIDYPAPLLHEWKSIHGQWVRENLNKKIGSSETANLLKKYTGEDSRMHIVYLPNKLYVSYIGRHPIRDVSITIKNHNEAKAIIDDLEQRKGGGLSADEAMREFSRCSSVVLQGANLSCRQSPTSSPLNYNIPDIQPNEKLHLSYEAIGSNGRFTGSVYLYRDNEGTMHHAHIGYFEDELIVEYPESYAKISESRTDPDWELLLAT